MVKRPETEYSQSDQVDILLHEVATSLALALEDLREFFDRDTDSSELEVFHEQKLPEKFIALQGHFSGHAMRSLDDFTAFDLMIVEFFDAIQEYLKALGIERRQAYSLAMSSMVRVRHFTLQAPNRAASMEIWDWARRMEAIEKELTSARAEMNALRTESTKFQSDSSAAAAKVIAASAKLDALESKWAKVDKHLDTQTKRYEELNASEAESILTKHFGDYKTNQSTTFVWYFVSGLALVVSGAIFGLFQSIDLFGTWQPRPTNSPTDIAWKIVITSSLVGLGSYLLRQASVHRRLVVWAESIGIQLKTFDAYVGLVDLPEQRSQLHAEFAKRIFGPEPLNQTQMSESSSAPTVVFDPTSIVNMITRQAKDGK